MNHFSAGVAQSSKAPKPTSDSTHMSRRESRMSHQWIRLSLSCLSTISLLALGAGCGGGGYDEYSETLGTSSEAVVTGKVVNSNGTVTLPVGSVLVNQLGYLADMNKVAIVFGTGCNARSFTLKQGSTILYTGTTGSAVTDPGSGDIVCKADFSSYTTAKTGVVIAVNGMGTSEQFNIGSTNQYPNLVADALNFFKYHRAGTQVVSISLTGSKGGTVSRSWAMRPTTTLLPYNSWAPNSTFPTDGGHLDAGDFGLYPDNAVQAMWVLGNIYERNNTTNTALLDEITYGVKFFTGLLPMGSGDTTKLAAHKLHDDTWATQNWGGYPSGNDVSTSNRHAMGPSITATYSMARALAQAARLNTSAPANYWTKAKEAWARANKSTSGTYAGPSPGAGVGGGDYPDMGASDDLFSAAVEMFLTAKAKSEATTDYLPSITGSSHYKSVSRNMDWESDATQGNLSLMAYHLTKGGISSQIDIPGIQTAIVSEANSALSTIASNGYPTPISGNNYVWGSNKVVVHAAMIMAYAHQLTGDCKYLKGIHQSMDYLLGVNTLAYSFITGYGTDYEKATHDRQANGNSPVGWLAGGPLSSGLVNDPVTPKLANSAKNYYVSDSGHDQAWCSRETTIDWNAPLVWVASYIAGASHTGCGTVCTPNCSGRVCGDDGCGGSCGTCGGGTTCNASGQCVSSCTPETDSAFCSRLGKNCGSVTANDNCGTQRTVSNCGTCTSPATCGGGGTSNVCGGGGGTSAFQQEADGQVWIEAEHYDATTANGTSDTWTAVSDGARSGGQYVSVGADSGNSWSSTYVNASPELEYRVNFTQTGTYRVWMLGGGVDGNSDSCHAGIDNTGPSTLQNFGGFSQSSGWGWRDTTAKTFTISTTGVHTIQIWAREDGFRLDKILISLNQSFTPSGLGDAESTRSGGSCTPETDSAFCSRLGKNCGSVTANDNCGTSRTVSNCGSCTSPATCGGGGTANVCGTASCTSETVAQFCSRLGKNCGSVTANDNCGVQRTYTCGSCTSPQTCGGGGTANVCGGSSCTPETDAQFCSRLGKNCGSVTANDNCGTSRTVSNCGSCTSPATCGGGGTANVCGTSSGTNPCASLCSNPIVFTTRSYSSGNLGSGATCHEYVGDLGGGNFGNFVSPRTLSINGVSLGSAGGNITLPAKRNGGYCFQATAGSYDYAYFGTW
jgi:endoglucanase